MQYISTRDKNQRVSAAQAIAMGIAPDGGLFCPTEIPKLTQDDIRMGRTLIVPAAMKAQSAAAEMLNRTRTAMGKAPATETEYLDMLASSTESLMLALRKLDEKRSRGLAQRHRMRTPSTGAR